MSVRTHPGGIPGIPGGIPGIIGGTPGIIGGIPKTKGSLIVTKLCIQVNKTSSVTWSRHKDVKNDTELVFQVEYYRENQIKMFSFVNKRTVINGQVRLCNVKICLYGWFTANAPHPGSFLVGSLVYRHQGACLAVACRPCGGVELQEAAGRRYQARRHHRTHQSHHRGFAFSSETL